MDQRKRMPARWQELAVIAVGFTILTLAIPRVVPQPQDQDALVEGQYPSDWFGAQRAYPGDVVPQDKYLEALEWARVERAAGALRTSSATPMVWQQAGPFNIGGRVTALAVVPGGTTLYLGAAAGGVFKSVNSGVNWTPVFDQVTSIGALALDPVNPAVVYAGTGESNCAVDNYDGFGLFRTNDAGATWQYLGLQETRRIARVKVDPTNPARIFVAAMGAQYSTGPHRGLYRSEDGGLNWTKVLFVNDSTGVCDVVINPAHPETMFCASWERIRRPTYRRAQGPGCGVWRSADGGTTWSRLAGGLPGPSEDVGRIGLAMAPSWSSRVYAQIIGPGTSYNGLGMWRTDDAGQTWVKRDVSGFSGGFGGFGWYFGDVVVDPTNANRVYALGVSLNVSVDGGATFGGATGNAHVDEHALWIDPGNPQHMYMGGDGGFFWTTLAGSSWTKSDDLPITQFYAGAVDPSNPARILGGAQDNNTPITSGSPTGWTYYYPSGDGFYCLIDPTNPAIGFAETQFGSSGRGPQRTVNSGASWSGPVSAIFDPNRTNWCAPFVMSPTDHNVMLAGDHRVWKSTNNGVSFALANGQDLTRNIPGFPYTSSLSTLEISAVNPNLYYAGTTDGRVWRSTTGGTIWQEITTGLPIRWVTRVTADPANASVVYVTLSGYSLDEAAAHVYRSTDQGASWTAIDGNLPDVPANDILVDPVNTNRLFLATDTGVYVTSNLGTTWSALGVGHPIVPVADLTLHNPSRTLVSATHGRSQWELDLNDLPVGVAVERPAPRLALSAPAPNPSDGAVRIELSVDIGGHATLRVFDPQGRRVADVLDRSLPAGRHTVTWNGRDARGARLPAGVYYLRAELDGRAAATRRVVRVD